MGAYCSIHNDTQDETVMVYVGVNTKVLQPILWSITGAATLLSGGVAMGSVPGVLSLTTSTTAAAAAAAGEASAVWMISVSTLTAAAGGLVSATNFVLEQLQTQLVNDLAKGGYHKLLPGQTYTTPKVTPSLNLRAWIVRIQKTNQAIIIQRSDASVWSGAKPNTRSVYRVLDKRIFSTWNTNHETIPIRYEHLPQEISVVASDDSSDHDTSKQQTHHHESKEQDEEEEEQFTILDSGRVDCECTVVEPKDDKATKSKMTVSLDQSTVLEGGCSSEDDDTWDLVDTDLQNEWVQIDAATTSTTQQTHHQAV